jgi:hypothetical protein
MEQNLQAGAGHLISTVPTDLHTTDPQWWQFPWSLGCGEGLSERCWNIPLNGGFKGNIQNNQNNAIGKTTEAFHGDPFYLGHPLRATKKG